MSCGAQAEAKKLGYQYSVTGPQQIDVAQQVASANAVTAKHPDGVLMEPVDSATMLGPETAMKQAGIKIVEVDTVLDDKSVALSHVATDNSEAGATVAREMAKQISDKGTILVSSIRPGLSSLDARVNGFLKEIKDNHPQISIVGPLYSNSDTAKAASNLTATISAHPDLAGVFAPDLVDVQGAAAALDQAGKAGKLALGSIDASVAAVDFLNKGVITVLVSQSPYKMGQLGVDQLNNAFTGKPVTPSITVPLGVVTKANLQDPAMKPFLYSTTC
jgi:ribose transport system substrate-binding protein